MRPARPFRSFAGFAKIRALKPKTTDYTDFTDFGEQVAPSVLFALSYGLGDYDTATVPTKLVIGTLLLGAVGENQHILGGRDETVKTTVRDLLVTE